MSRGVFSGHIRTPYGLEHSEFWIIFYTAVLRMVRFLSRFGGYLASKIAKFGHNVANY
jgi:hypothetical protein